MNLVANKTLNMQNLKKDDYVWVIYVNGIIQRKKVESLKNIVYDDYTDENIFKNYKLLYKTHASYDSIKNKFFETIDTINSNVFGTAFIIQENGSVKNWHNPKEHITNILLLSSNKYIGFKFPTNVNKRYEISRN